MLCALLSERWKRRGSAAGSGIASVMELEHHLRPGGIRSLD